MAELGRAIVKEALAKILAPSGATLIGVSAIGDIAAGNLQAFLASLKTQVDAILPITHDDVATANKDGAVDVPSMRTLGTGALQSASGNRGAPTGGSTGQALVKTSGSDYAFAWQAVSGAAGAAHALLSVTHSDVLSSDTPANNDILRRVAGLWEASLLTDLNVAAANKDGVAGTASMRTLGTGSQQSCAGNDARLTRLRPIEFYNGADPLVEGAVSLTGKASILRAGVITRVVAEVVGAPTGTGIGVSIKKNGGAFHTMTIAAGQTKASSTGLSLVVADGDYLTMELTSVGSSVAGSKLTVTCEQAI